MPLPECLRWAAVAPVALLIASCVAVDAGDPSSSRAIAPVAAPTGYLVIEALPADPAHRGKAGRWNLYLGGYIESGATSRLAALLAQEHVANATVYFDSPGGSLVEGMALGRLLRERGFDTDVGRRGDAAGRPLAGRCYSACPFAYAGGVRRYLAAGSVLGVHRAENRTPVPDEAAFQQRVAQDASGYLAAMGVAPGLLALMAGAPHDRIRTIGREEALGLRLVNEPATAVP